MSEFKRYPTGFKEYFHYYTNTNIPFLSRLWRYKFSPLYSGLWLAKCQRSNGRIAYIKAVYNRAIIPQFFPDRYTRREFKWSLKDGGFWKRLYLYMMNYQCDWNGCELCRPDIFTRDDDYE